ncbi:hypothetical protein V6N13_041042 [Hibiscus sabdariffa]
MKEKKKPLDEDDPKSEPSHGIFPAIISGSIEDQASTMEKWDAFNASDSHIQAGKEKVDDPSPSIIAQEKELTSQSDNGIKDKIGKYDDNDSYPITDGFASSFCLPVSNFVVVLVYWNSVDSVLKPVVLLGNCEATKVSVSAGSVLN